MVRYKDWVYIRNAFPARQNLLGESTRQFPAGKELWDAHDKGLTAPEQEDVFLQPREGEELYDLGADPHQFRNLVSDKKHQESLDRKSTRLNSSHVKISYAVFCLKKKR